MYCPYSTYCKYHRSGICTVDNEPCDYSSESVFGTGTHEEHCHQENNEQLCKIGLDCFLMPDPPLEPFFSCYNLCKYYYSCDKT